MNRTVYSVVSLAIVLVACAHDRSSQHTGDVASAEQRAEARSESNASLDQSTSERGDGRVEPVEVDRRRAERPQGTASSGAIPAAASGSAGDQNKGHAPDNTGVNERDRSGAQLTPMDQGNGEVDRDITQRIRKAVMADDSLSFTAKNTKIITRDGRVTLRGPVKSAAEKDAIYKCAVSAAGVGRVMNELEVDAK
jgi:hyperosmotically inducible periplasmic protein